MTHAAPKGFLFGSATYDKLKFFAQVTLPAIATLYFTVAQIWHFPNPEEVVGTIVAIDTFLGALLHISSKTYEKSEAAYDGVMHVGGQKDRLEFHGDLETLEKMKSITFKVQQEEDPPTKLLE